MTTAPEEVAEVIGSAEGILGSIIFLPITGF